MGGLPKLAAVKDHSINGKLKLTLPQGAFDGDTTEKSFFTPTATRWC